MKRMLQYEANTPMPGRSVKLADLTKAYTRRDRDHDRAEALRALGSVVYAISTPDDLIKIGHTTDLTTRGKHVAGELIAVMPGSYNDEQAIHSRLIDHRARGREWYHRTPEVIAVVNMIRASVGMGEL